MGWSSPWKWAEFSPEMVKSSRISEGGRSGIAGAVKGASLWLDLSGVCRDPPWRPLPGSRAGHGLRGALSGSQISSGYALRCLDRAWMGDEPGTATQRSDHRVHTAGATAAATNIGAHVQHRAGLATVESAHCGVAFLWAQDENGFHFPESEFLRCLDGSIRITTRQLPHSGGFVGDARSGRSICRRGTRPRSGSRRWP